MRYKIVHLTAYTYSSDVSISHHVAHLTPRDLPSQRSVSHRLVIEPGSSSLDSRLDYFANETSIFTVIGAHRSLKVTATSEIEVSPRAVPVDSPPWEEVRDGSAIEHSARLNTLQFIYPSQFIPRLATLRDYAASTFTPKRPALDCVLDLSRRIHQDFTFDTRATTIATPMEQVLKNRRGVCQDFAHLYIGCARAFGLPARYVSGYLETLPPPGKTKLAGADASHAWVQVYVPPTGWVDVDPTNDLLPYDRHVTVAWGRDFDDVSPIRGVIVGGGKHTLRVGVDVIPEL